MPQDLVQNLVAAHGNWIYSAALRQVRNPHLAEDVTQAVFLLATRRTRELHAHPNPAGWLFRTLTFCAREALRRQRRQVQRDQEAARMKTDQVEAEGLNWDEVSPLLDEAVSGLSEADRQAVLLRFYQRLAFAEVGQALGTSEDAARARVSRAVGKLRDILARQGVTASSTGLSAVMLAHVTHEMPAQLAQALLQGGSAVAVQLVSASEKVILLAKAKLAAALLVTAGLVGFGTTMALRHPADPINGTGGSPAKPLPAVLREEDESKAPGQIQVARWDVVLNEQGMLKVEAALKKMDTTSKGFQAYEAKARELRAAVVAALDGEGVERWNREMWFGQNLTNGQLQFPLYMQWGNYLDSVGNKVIINFGPQDTDDKFDRTETNRIKLTLKYNVPNLILQEFANGWQRQTFAPAEIACDRELAPGESVVFIAALPGNTGKTYYGMVVWEGFTANSSEMLRASSMREVALWCRSGPAKLREWSNIATVWASKSNLSTLMDLARFSVKLEDGKTARLAGLTAPSKWPFVWWDALGNPTTEYNGMVGLPQEGIAGMVLVEGPVEEWVTRSPIGKPDFNLQAPYNYLSNLRIAEADLAHGKVEAAVLVGPWKEIGRLKKGVDELKVGATTYRVSRPNAFGKEEFLVHWDVTGPQPDATILVAVGGENQAVCEDQLEAAVVPQKLEQLSSQPNFHGMALEKVEYFKVMQRKRQLVVFEGIASEPKLKPPATITADEAQVAQQVLADREGQRQLQNVLDRRKAWQQTPADAHSAKGAMRAFCNAIIAEDKAAAERFLSATTPKAEEMGRKLVIFMIERQRAHVLAAKRFGEVNVVEKLGGLLNDVDDEFRDAKVEAVAGETDAVQLEGFALRKGADGIYRINMDRIAAEHGVQFEAMLRQMDFARAIRLLETGAAKTLDQVRDALTSAPATQK